MGLLRTLARAYHNDPYITTADSGRLWHPFGTTVPFLNAEGNLVDPARVMTHPSFPLVEGQGIYTYPFNPDVTRNLVHAPVTKVDAAVQRTLSSNILIQTAQVDEDIVVTEVWLAGERRVSTLAEMFRTFYSYWTTLPAVGESIGWEPLDITTDRYAVQIVDVQLGGIDIEYREIRPEWADVQNAYLDQQLTLKLKLVDVVVPPKGSITLTGL